ncbi:N-6 DNA methylase [Candidatus Poribacteria bacterium]|nr:N-6 DNA methylase [Candidatus Poribacteria bacterium]
MEITPYTLSSLYARAHDAMRNMDGLQPQEAFDELLKFLFFKQANEELGPPLSSSNHFGFNGLFAKLSKALVANIRELFSNYVQSFNSWFCELWKDASFHLSDTALLTLWQLFNEVQFTNVPFDVRSTALKEFLSPEMRRGLGIYLTPDDVVKMMVEFVNPSLKSSVYDPACGSGTFLVETLKLHKRMSQNDWSKTVIWGTDKNPRMLLISELNLGHFPGITFKRRVADALFPDLTPPYDWPKAESFDVIFTNPPFGVTLDNTSYDLRRFKICRAKNGYLVKRQQSEVMFIEQALYYLEPGGILAIVLPKSVITNATLDTARKALDRLGYIYAAVSLPPETFATAGTQASTIVLFIKKFSPGENSTEEISIAYADVTNVGYDATGRTRPDNQLITLVPNLNVCLTTQTNVEICHVLPKIAKDSTFSELSNLTATVSAIKSQIKLRDVVAFAATGKTPPRQSYTEKGLFVVKVGNLTGNGINWIPRDRNFIHPSELSRRLEQNLVLQEGDILLTSSAHSSVYIAKKVDIVNKVPEWIGEVASFVGEVMLIRPNKELIDPFILLAYLRSSNVVQQIQRFVRGQTAHLYTDDVLELPLPSALLNPDENLEKVASTLRLEAELNQKLNDCAFEQNKLLDNISFGQ